MRARARVMAALRGDPVDRVPVSVWAHNFTAENSAQELCEETVRLAREFDWDYLKPQSRAHCFAEMWGLKYAPSLRRSVPPTVTAYPLHAAGDLESLRPADARTGALGEQLEALALIRARIGPDRPIIWTIFSPLTTARYLFPGGDTQITDVMRSEPSALEGALEAMTETLAEYARACVQHGADGIFLATTLARKDVLSAGECRRFERKYDLAILQAVEQAPFNVMHVCGDNVLFEEFVDHPVAAFSWAATPNNPSLSEVHRRTGRAAIGGLPAKPVFKTLTATQAREHARKAVSEMHGRWLLLGPECSIDPETPASLLRAVSGAVREPH
jgi:uroporphyrinogen decarboxylase